MRQHDLCDEALPVARRAARGLGVVASVVIGAAGTLTAAAAASDEPLYRYEAPIAVQRSAPFVEAVLPAEAYARSRRGLDAAGLADLRIVDARGERVPFAWLAARGGESATRETLRDVAMFALPARPAADGSWRAPIDVVVDGDRVRVRRLGGSTAAAPGGRSGGWVFDLGERKPGEPAPDELRLVWSGPEEFSAAFDLATSDDLRSWRFAGGGQVLALQPGSPSGAAALTQPKVVLPASAGRFVRLVWADAAAAPRVTAARAVTLERETIVRDAPAALSFDAQPASAAAAADPLAARSAVFDLGGTLPLVDVALQWKAGTHVAPVRIQGRERSDEPWRELGAAVFYRLEREGSVSVSPAWGWRGGTRYLRFVPDARAAALDAAQTRLLVHADLAHLVFATQGTPPYRVQLGAAQAPSAALPIGALVPALDDERARFGAATIGAWSEVATVARRDEAREREAALRPWLLWAVLVAGVAGLAFMVWRLARGARAPV